MDKGKRLKFFRTKHLKFTQEKFAGVLKISQPSLSRYELGVTPVPTEIIDILIEKYNLNANWFYTGRGSSMVRSLEDIIRGEN